jgi:starvation-inducible DNA-binding protein
MEDPMEDPMVRMAQGASSESARAEAFGPREVRAGYALSGNIRAQSLDLLNRHLAAAIDLYAQVKQAHWNVRGRGFIVVHQLFDKIAVEIMDYCDLLALRAEELGGTIQVAATPSFLLPYTLGIAHERAHALAIAGALAMFGKSVFAASVQGVNSGDADTAELFAEILWSVEQQLWRVQSPHCAVPAQSVYPRAPPRDRVDRACDLRVAARYAAGKRPVPIERKVNSGAVPAEVK